MCFSLFGSLFLLPSHLLFPEEPPDREAARRRSEWSAPQMLSPPHWVCDVLYTSFGANLVEQTQMVYASQEMKFYPRDVLSPDCWALPLHLSSVSPSSLPLLFESFSPRVSWCGVIRVLWYCVVTVNFMTFHLAEFLCSLWRFYFRKTTLVP